MLIVAGVLLAALAVLIVVEPILRSRSHGPTVPRSLGPSVLFPDSDDEEDPVQRRRDLALAALKEIEFDRATGKLAEQDYQRLHATYTQEAVAVLRELEQASAVPSVPPVPLVPSDPVEALIAQARARRPRARFCEQCGSPLVGRGKYCAECGSPVPV